MPWEVQIHHINVDQGDSALILLYQVTGSKKTLSKSVLIDGGKPGPGINSVLPYLQCGLIEESGLGKRCYCYNT